MTDPRKDAHVLETDVKNRLRDAREAVDDVVALLEEGGADPTHARDKVVSSLARFEEDRLEALADALSGLGEENSSALVRTIARFAGPDGDLLDPFSKTQKKPGTGLKEPFKTEPKKTEPKLSDFISNLPPLPKGLVWPFPPPRVLREMRMFIQYSLSLAPALYKALGRQGELYAARHYLTVLKKHYGPDLAGKLKNAWDKARLDLDTERMNTLRQWWRSLSDVLALIDRMSTLLKRYEKSPGWSDRPGFHSRPPSDSDLMR